MSTTDPRETLRIFQHERVAAGYALDRPYLHPAVFAMAREQMGLPGRLGRALDVGCGTGLSTVALRNLADHVVGCDASVEMLRHASRVPGVSYVAAAAEHLPLAAGRFDLVLACGSMDWIDRVVFLPQAAALLRPGGWLVSLDFGDAGRSPDTPALGTWYRTTYLPAYPCPAARDPMVAADEALRCGFSAPAHREFSLDHPFTSHTYAAFLMTESSVVASVEFGTRTAAETRRWLEAELAEVFGGEPRRVTFGGYIQAMRLL